MGEKHSVAPLIYLRVECFGGVCDHSGWVAQNGSIVQRFEPDANSTLTEIFKAADIELNTGILPFLERNVFIFDDDAHMRRAMALARKGDGFTGKNPSVGCVLTRNGQQISEGATAEGGTPHAEEVALSRIGGYATDATAYVTLEPCRQRSAGGVSCSEKLIQSGITRVVCALADQHPNGAGGFDRLREAGISVETGLMQSDAEHLYRPFFSRL